MGIITRMLKMKAVYWPPESSESGGDDFDDYGQPQVSDPVEIDCRWEEVSEEFLDAQGTAQISRAKVFVDRDVEVGGILMLGLLADVTDLVNPKENENAWEIRRFDKFPNLRVTEYLRTVYL